jgi:hypothetical protein
MHKDLLNSLDDNTDEVLKTGLELIRHHYHDGKEKAAVIIAANIAAREQDEWERRFKLAQREALMIIADYKNALDDSDVRTGEKPQPSANLYGLLVRLNSILGSDQDMIQYTILATGYDAETMLRILVESNSAPLDFFWIYAVGLPLPHFFEYCLDKVEQYGKALYLMKEDHFSTEEYLKLCTAAVKQDGMALQYVNIATVEAEYPELCRAAIEQDERALQYVKGENCTPEQYTELCLLAIHQFAKNRAADDLHRHYRYMKTIVPFVDLKVCTGEQYAEICLAAISYDSKELEQVNEHICTPERYYEICLAAVNKDASALARVKEHIIAARYRELCMTAIRRDETAIRHVKEYFLNGLTADQYFEMCLAAVKKNGGVLSSVDEKYLSAAHYFELCRIAVPQNGSAIRYIRAEDCTAEEYFELCRMAVSSRWIAVIQSSRYLTAMICSFT